MIDALIAGRLFGAPLARTAKTGSQYCTAKVRVGVPDGQAIFATVIAFSQSACAALLALADGDSVALSGELTIGTYAGKDGTARVSLDLKAHAVLTPYHVRRRRAAVRGETEEGDLPAAPASAEEAPAATNGHTDRDFNDEVPF